MEASCMVNLTHASKLFVPGINGCSSASAQHLVNKIAQSISVHKYGYFADGLVQNVLGRACENDYPRKQYKSDNSCEALESLYLMNRLGVKPTKVVLCAALNTCAKMLSWHLGMQIHAYMIRSGYEDNLFLNSALVDFYSKCDAIVDAMRVFDDMKVHDKVSWTSIIAGLSQNGQGRNAFLMFKEMLGTQIKPNCYTYASIISACVEQEGVFARGSALHGHVIKQGFSTSHFVFSSLIDCYAKCGKVDDAMLLFNENSEKDTILYNSMISAYSQNRSGEDALKLFVEMKKKNLSPSNHTLTSILNACGSLTVLFQGRQVHCLVIKMGSERNVFVVSALIDMYSKSGDVDGARFVLDQTSEKNTVLWTSMIMGYAQSGRGSYALELFDHLLTENGFIPDHICFTAVLTACNHTGLLDKGVEYFNKMRTIYRLYPDLDQYACLIDLYARNGNLRKAKDLMEEMPYDPNYVIWSSILGSCKIHGEVELGKEAANQLIKMEPCNAASYITLAHIYARNGLWADVVEIRNILQEKRIRKNAGWSWIEVDRRINVFAVGDVTHPQSNEIYAELDKIYLRMNQVSSAGSEVRRTAALVE